MLQNRGDAISFVSDEDEDWPFTTGHAGDDSTYQDVTNAIIKELIAQGILRDDGIAWQDPVEPDTIFIRDLHNIWMD